MSLRIIIPSSVIAVFCGILFVRGMYNVAPENLKGRGEGATVITNLEQKRDPFPLQEKVLELEQNDNPVLLGRSITAEEVEGDFISTQKAQRTMIEIVGDLADLPMGLDGVGLFQAKIREMADIDLIYTFRFLATTEDFSDEWTSVAAVNLVLNRMSEVTDEEVISFFSEDTDGQSILAKDPLVMGELFRGWYGSDPGGAIEALANMPAPLYNSAMRSSLVMQTLFSGSPDFTFDSALSHSSTSGNWTALSNVARLSVTNDPEWFAEKLVKTSNDFANADDKMFIATAESFAHSWARRDLSAALVWIDQRPKAVRDQLIKNEWPRIAEWDKDSALSWINSVSDEKIRNKLINEFR